MCWGGTWDGHLERTALFETSKPPGGGFLCFNLMHSGKPESCLLLNYPLFIPFLLLQLGEDYLGLNAYTQYLLLHSEHITK